MQPLELLMLTLPVWILTNFWLLPLFREQWKAKELGNQITRVGMLTIIEKIRDLSVVTNLAIISLMILVALGTIFSSLDIEAPKSFIDKMASFYDSVKSFNKSYSQALLWLGLISAAICLFVIGKQAKKKITDAWIAKAHEINEKINNDYEFLQELRNNSDLIPIIDRVDEVSAALMSSQNSEDGLMLTEEEYYELQNEYQYLLTMVSLEQAKIEINIEETLTNKTEVSKVKKSKVDRVYTILMSKRFAKDLGLMSRSMSILITALLLISLTSWASSPLANSLQLTVNNLRIHVLDKAVDRELATEISKIEINTEDDRDNNIDSDTTNANVARVSRALAQVSVNRLINSEILMRSVGISTRVAESSASKAEFVRAAIVGQQYEVKNQADATQKVRKEVSNKLSQALSAEDVSRLIDDAERQIRPSMEKIGESKPSILARLADKIEIRYSTSISALDAQSNLVSNIIGQSISGLDSKINSEVAKEGMKILQDVGKNSVSTWVNTHTKSLITEILTDQARNEVVAKMQQDFQFQVSNETKQFVSNLHTARNTGWSPSKAESTERKITKELADKVASSYSDDAVKNMVRQSLGGYSELFPAAADIASGVAHTGSGSVSKTSSNHIKTRSSNFKMASKSFRVRGVLFGQELTGDNLTVTHRLDIKR